jgi:alpha-tubulin suppressor-like RCC1 family protein
MGGSQQMLMGEGGAGSGANPNGLFVWSANGITLSTASAPVQVGANSKWNAVSCGYSSTLAFKSDGTMWSWGLNGKGQLGDGSTTTRSSPVQIAGTTWSTGCMGANTNSTCTAGAIRLDGTLWMWGDNSVGQCGQNSTATTSYSSPIQVGSGTTWKSIAISQLGAVLAIKTDNTMWGWGYNLQGNLGLGTLVSVSSPVQVSGTAWAAASLGQYHSLALTTGGLLFATGLSNTGQLGLGALVDKSSFTQVGSNTWLSITACTANYGSAGVDTVNKLWTWGTGNYGAGGTNNTTAHSVPTQVGALTNWLFVSKGDYAGLAIKTDGTLWGWGYNASGQLGDGTTTHRSSPVQIGSATTWLTVSCGTYDSAGIHT